MDSVCEQGISYIILKLIRFSEAQLKFCLEFGAGSHAKMENGKFVGCDHSKPDPDNESHGGKSPVKKPQ